MENTLNTCVFKHFYGQTLEEPECEDLLQKKGTGDLGIVRNLCSCVFPEVNRTQKTEYREYSRVLPENIPKINKNRKKGKLVAKELWGPAKS